MRLGKEQAAGYVEDTEADSLPVTGDSTVVTAQASDAAAPEPSLTTS